jgi:hypothetical protein
MSEPSSLASVVRVQTWPKTDDKNVLALFHTKFWGKNMKDEESEWCDTQPVSRDNHGVADQDGDERMDLDEDERMDEGDDVISGCYVLDIDIDGLGMSSLWIRADYIRIYNFFQAHYDNYAKPRGRAPSAVLTGQPGIGESSRVASPA